MATHPELKLQMVIKKEMEMKKRQDPDPTAEVAMSREETDHMSQEEEAVEAVAEEVEVVAILSLKMSAKIILETSRATLNKLTRDQIEGLLVAVVTVVDVETTEVVAAEVDTKKPTTK